MSNNYAPRLPQDGYNTPMQEYPSPKKALARATLENGTASSVITLTQDTTTVEVAAVGGAAVVRWIQTTDTTASVISIAGATANYDHVVSKDTIRRFVVPIESFPQTAGSVMGANRNYGLYQRVAIKSMGVASVLTAEY